MVIRGYGTVLQPQQGGGNGAEECRGGEGLMGIEFGRGLMSNV